MWAVAFAMTHCRRIDLYGFMPTRVNGTWQYGRYYHTLDATKREGGASLH